MLAFAVDERRRLGVQDALWLEMGAPQQVSREQYAELEKAGKLAMLDAPEWVDVEGGVATLEFPLPRQGVSLVVLSWDD